LFWYAEISQTKALHVALLVSLENSRLIGLHWFGSRLFEATEWKLLITEPFFQQKLNKIKTENRVGIW
jgi:hypothetical protein